MKRSAAAGVWSLAIANGRLFAENSGDVPGKWSFSPEVLVSGENTNLELRYMHGDETMPPNSYHRISIEPYSVKSLFHCHPSEEYKIVPYKGKLPNIKLEKGRVTGLGTILKFSFPDGLKPGENFALRLGNKEENGKIKAIVNPIPMKDIPVMVFSNLREKYIDTPLDDRRKMWDGLPGEINWFDAKWEIPKATVVADKAEKVRVFGPTLIEAGDKFDLKLSVVDRFDSKCNPVYKGEVTISENSNIKGLPEEAVFEDSDQSSKIIKDISISKPGTFRIKVKLESTGKEFESNPIVVKDKVEEPIYWGNIHNHNCYSECWGRSMDEFYSFARDISGLDFVSISDHRGTAPTKSGSAGRLLKWKLGYEVSRWDSWKDTIDTAAKYNEPGRFGALVGYETGGTTPEGRNFHMNVYYADMEMDNINTYFPSKRVNVDLRYEQLRKLDHVIFIPHKHGNYFPYKMLQTTKAKDGYPLTPGIEIYSDLGDAFSPYGTWEIDSLYGGKRGKIGISYQEAVEKGYKLSVIADSDSHTGLPGRRSAGGLTPSHDHPQGITAVRSSNLTRKDIIRSYQKRKTYGTTGKRIYLNISVNGSKMGESIHVEGPFEFKVEAAGTDTIESISLFNGMNLIEKKKPGKRDCELTFKCSPVGKDERPYYILLVQKDENRAWSTPIWIRKKSDSELT